MRLSPAGWRRVELEEVAEIQTGLAKGSVKFDDPIELPYLRVANVQDGYLDLTEVKTVQVERRRVDRYRLRHGDVLLTEGGDFDKLGRGAVAGQCLCAQPLLSPHNGKPDADQQVDPIREHRRWARCLWRQGLCTAADGAAPADRGNGFLP